MYDIIFEGDQFIAWGTHIDSSLSSPPQRTLLLRCVDVSSVRSFSRGVSIILEAFLHWWQSPTRSRPVFSFCVQFCCRRSLCCCARQTAPHLRLSLCGGTPPAFTESRLALLLNLGTNLPAESPESPPGQLRRLVPPHYPLFRCAAWMFSSERERGRQALEHVATLRKGLMCSIW